MKISVISLTEKGRGLSQRLSGLMPGYDISRHCLFTHTDEAAEPFDKLSETVRSLWDSSDALIFICACGIAVRSVAPLLHSKLTDPAVIVIDDCGRFVIPVLSGHIGKANALAGLISEALGAQPVITTATDIGGLFSPDSFAATNGLLVTDFTAAKRIASAVLDGEPLGLVSGYEMKNVPDIFVSGSGAEACAFGLYIGTDKALKPFPVTLTLVPRDIVLGIGCKKGISADELRKRISEALRVADIDPARVCAAATIDIKRAEPGLIDCCKDLGIELLFYSAEELSAAPGEFTPSDFVKGVTGVDNVCERSAVLCSGGALVMRKQAGGGITVAAAEKPFTIDFERKQI